jgi:hypothetical protein
MKGGANMDSKDLQLIESHVDQDPELKALWDEHLRFEQQLEKIEKKLFLNPEEKVEKKRLQLAKLVGKTRIEEILTRYRAVH